MDAPGRRGNFSLSTTTSFGTGGAITKSGGTAADPAAVASGSELGYCSSVHATVYS